MKKIDKCWYCDKEEEEKTRELAKKYPNKNFFPVCGKCYRNIYGIVDEKDRIIT